MGTITQAPGVVETVDHDGAAFSVVYEPGNGTRYDTTFVPIDRTNGYYLVSLPDFGRCYRFHLWDSHPAYIAEKVNLSVRDGEALAALFAAVWEQVSA